jgi:hypothetical protein
MNAKSIFTIILAGFLGIIIFTGIGFGIGYYIYFPRYRQAQIDLSYYIGEVRERGKRIEGLESSVRRLEEDNRIISSEARTGLNIIEGKYKVKK